MGKVKKNLFKKAHPFHPALSTRGRMPEAEATPTEWQRLSQEDFARVANPAPDGYFYTHCDAEGRPGSARLLRPQGTQGETAVQRYMQKPAKSEEMRPVHLEKMFNMWNSAIREHSAQSCQLPQFALAKEIPKGVVVKMSLKCANCTYEGSMHNLYTEVPAAGRGAKAAAPNAALQVGLQDTPIGNKGARHLLACLNMPPPARSGMYRLGKTACTRAAIANEEELKKRRQETRRTNKIRGLPEDAPINCSFDGRYNSTVIASRNKAGQNASQAIALVTENQTSQKQILGAALENKLCYKGAQLRSQGLNVTCPDHAGCSATLPACEPLSERRLGERLGEQFAQDNVPLKYLTTDGDATGSSGMLTGLQKHNARAEMYRKADPIHIGQAQIREVMKTTFSDQMFSGATKDVEKDQQREFAKDLKKRCYAIHKQLLNECGGDVNKMKAKVPGIIETTLNCYSGDCSKCSRHSVVCRGGKINNWWSRSEHLMTEVMGRERHVNMTETDRGVLCEIMHMMLGDAALDLLDQGTNTTKCEAANRGLSVSLPKNVNFARQAYNRMHSAVHRLNNGPGESPLLKMESAGAPPGHGGRVAAFFSSQQKQWYYQQVYNRSLKRKQGRSKAKRKQRTEHYTSKVARKGRDKYKKHQLDPKPETSMRQRQQRRRLKEKRAEALEEHKQNKLPRRSSRQAKQPAPKREEDCKEDHTYSR